ncbi:unnamed protein product [Notodromas monacha]|uniref:Mitochondrial fission 1 protein n=1 Tax=Notodromas monacha TaxID=399045 RepID=A0A7R9BKZ9_9CRUS|nr:unnamed protein product [Notodromas monacha]CAG0917426.1 unnamed protein product [Notodromas monacha]
MFSEPDEVETAILEDFGDASELKRLEALYFRQQERMENDPKVRWDYAISLVRSKYMADIKSGRRMMEEIMADPANEEIQIDCLYFLSLACAKLKDYKDALQYVRELLRRKPNHMQAVQLERIISGRLEREGMKGMAILGGAAMGIGALIGLGVALARRK